MQEVHIIHQVFWILIEPPVQNAVWHGEIDFLTEALARGPRVIVEHTEFREVCVDGPLVLQLASLSWVSVASIRKKFENS